MLNDNNITLSVATLNATTIVQSRTIALQIFFPTILENNIISINCCEQTIAVLFMKLLQNLALVVMCTCGTKIDLLI